MGYVRESAIVGGKEITIETGKWAKQAGGSVVIRCGDSMVLVTAAGSQQPRYLPFEFFVVADDRCCKLGHRSS